MFRTSDIVLIAIMVSAAAFTYKIKQGSEDQLAAVRKIEASIRFEEDSINLLQADWSLLTQPSRLQKLAERYQSELKLEAVDAHQYVNLADLPERKLDIRDILNQPLDAIAKGDETDDTKTGAVQ